MSEENQNLGEEAKDKLNDAAESAKEKVSELADDAKEAFEDVKEKASEITQDAKEAVNEFNDDAKDALSDGKTVAIIAHLTLIGWIIAYVKNSSNKTEIGSFYIRQMLGLVILNFIWVIPFLGWILGLVVTVLWIVSLVSALNGKMKPIPVLGSQFQEWFKSI